MRVDNNGGGSVYYEPNSFGGPTETPENKQAEFTVSGTAASVSYDHHDHYTQPGDLYRLLSDEERTRLVANIVGAMSRFKVKKSSFDKLLTSTKQIRNTERE